MGSVWNDTLSSHFACFSSTVDNVMEHSSCIAPAHTPKPFIFYNLFSVVLASTAGGINSLAVVTFLLYFIKDSLACIWNTICIGVPWKQFSAPKLWFNAMKSMSCGAAVCAASTMFDICLCAYCRATRVCLSPFNMCMCVCVCLI